MSRLTIYSRPGCHLCDEMKALVARVAPTTPVEVIDISNTAELEARYGLEIPVLLLDGRKVAKYRITEADLKKLLASANG